MVGFFSVGCGGSFQVGKGKGTKGRNKRGKREEKKVKCVREKYLVLKHDLHSFPYFHVFIFGLFYSYNDIKDGSKTLKKEFRSLLKINHPQKIASRIFLGQGKRKLKEPGMNERYRKRERKR